MAQLVLTAVPAERTNPTPPIRIAMWSGPRNISTAMMRSWGNREDTVVVDEPFYAFYLKATGKNHPGANEVIAHGETDWRKIVAECGTGPSAPRAKRRSFYQKQMTHHLLPEVDRDWLGKITNCFLIRDPAEVICSYIKKNEDPNVEDLGFRAAARNFQVGPRSNGRSPSGDRSRGCFAKSRSERCASFAKRSRLNSIRQCCRGRRACARPTGSGRNTGTMKWPNRHRFAHTHRRMNQFQNDCAKFTIAVGNVTRSFINSAFCSGAL